jgi:diadenosine tetraphosphatase ApaH/serine/threonine PP2A family protein phosphatase
MSTTLALFGGVYANARALAAVLEDSRALGAGGTWCLGDLGGFGPHPDRAIERLRAAGVPSLRGNLDDTVGHDRDDCACGYGDPRDVRFSQLSFEYTVARTSAAAKAWLRGLPEQARLEVEGRRVLLCHGSPRRVNEFLWESTCSDAFLERLCDAHAADVIACSHTGLPWHRALPSGRHVVNAGAIGRPANDGRPGEAAYAALTLGDELRVEFRRVRYDATALVAEMREESLPGEFVETILTGWWTTCLECLPAKERRAGEH